jgi:hypothetical protein
MGRRVPPGFRRIETAARKGADAGEACAGCTPPVPYQKKGPGLVSLGDLVASVGEGFLEIVGRVDEAAISLAVKCSGRLAAKSPQHLLEQKDATPRSQIIPRLSPPRWRCCECWLAFRFVSQDGWAQMVSSVKTVSKSTTGATGLDVSLKPILLVASLVCSDISPVLSQEQCSIASHQRGAST